MHTYRGASPFCCYCRGGGAGAVEGKGRTEGEGRRGAGAEGRAQRGSSASCAPPPWPVPTEHVPDPATGVERDPLDQMQQEGRRTHQQQRADQSHPRQRSGSNNPRAQKNTYRKASTRIDDGRRRFRETFLPHQRSEGLNALVNPVRVEPRWQRAGSGRTRDDRSLRRALANDAEERRAEEPAACSEPHHKHPH